LDASNPRRVDGIHVLHLLDCAQHLDDLPDVEAVAGRPSGAFPCSYEPLATHDRRSPCDAKAVALTASGSFAAADGVLGRRRDGPRHAHRARALRAWSATMAHKQRPSRGLRVGPDPACPDEESGSWWRSALSKPTFSGPRGFKRRQRRASRALAVSALRGAQKAKSRGKGNPDRTATPRPSTCTRTPVRSTSCLAGNSYGAAESFRCFRAAALSRSARSCCAEARREAASV
jgi:hypothetical protein